MGVLEKSWVFVSKRVGTLALASSWKLWQKSIWPDFLEMDALWTCLSRGQNSVHSWCKLLYVPCFAVIRLIHCKVIAIVFITMYLISKLNEVATKLEMRWVVCTALYGVVSWSYFKKGWDWLTENNDSLKIMFSYVIGCVTMFFVSYDQKHVTVAANWYELV